MTKYLKTIDQNVTYESAYNRERDGEDCPLQGLILNVPVKLRRTRRRRRKEI